MDVRALNRDLTEVHREPRAASSDELIPSHTEIKCCSDLASFVVVESTIAPFLDTHHNNDVLQQATVYELLLFQTITTRETHGSKNNHGNENND